MKILEKSAVFENRKYILYQDDGVSRFYSWGGENQAETVTLHSASVPLLYCRYLRKSYLTKETCQRRVNQPFLSLEYFYSGHMYFRSGGKTFLAEAGDMVFLHPHCTHEFLYLPGEPCRKAAMIFSGELLDDILRAFHLDGVGSVCLPDAERVDRLLEKVKSNLLHAVNPAALDALAGVSFEILQVLATAHRTAPVPHEVAEIQAYLERNLSLSLNMKVLASEFGMSVPTFNKRFFAALNITPYRYLIRLRMTRAAYLFSQDKWSVKEVAEMVGYSNALNFSTEFRKYYGKSPLAYRKECLESIRL